MKVKEIFSLETKKLYLFPSVVSGFPLLLDPVQREATVFAFSELLDSLSRALSLAPEVTGKRFIDCCNEESWFKHRKYISSRS